MDTGKFNDTLQVALSGGGFRATAFGLGVLLYLAHSGLNKNVKTITSVSGGSITNGFVAQECEFSSPNNVKEFRTVVMRLAKIISGEGKYRGFWLVSRPYLGFVFVTGVLLSVWALLILNGLVAKFVFDAELREVSLDEFLLWFLVFVVWGSLVLMREYVVRWWLGRTFFHRSDGKSTTLGEISHRSIDHVFCATDVTNSTPLFFSTKGGGRLYSVRYGRGKGKEVPLGKAVAASAAFPPLIPPIQLKCKELFKFSAAKLKTCYLSDGGVWNNLGTDWSWLGPKVRTAEVDWQKKETGAEKISAAADSTEAFAGGDVLLIANASKPDKGLEMWMVKIPVISFGFTLTRVLSVAVNSTIAGRLHDIESATIHRMLNNPRRWEWGQKHTTNRSRHVWGEDHPLAVLVEMTRKPGETTRIYQMEGGLKQWEKMRAERLHKRDEGPLEQLAHMWEDEAVVPTTLDDIGANDTLRMIVLGYLNTRETLTAAFGHEPLEIPEPKWFRELVPRSRQ